MENGKSISKLYSCLKSSKLLLYAKANISTKEVKKTKKTWLSSQNGFPCWSKGYKKKNCPRSEKSYYLMLSRKKRLNLKKSFQFVRSGQVVEGAYLKLYFKTSDKENSAKVGIAVSSRNFKKAHTRNRARRLVSAAFENIYDSLPPNALIIALPKVPILDVKSEEVLKDLKKILIKSKIL